jgi:PhnB protein
VQLFAADAAGDQPPLRCEGMMLSLLGTADVSTLKDWFSRLSEGGQVVDDLQVRPWGASDGQVIDRYGLHWLIGFKDDKD